MNTKQRILDAAEQLFAEHGFDGASLRRITAAAGVNLAAVNYHFKTKETLVQAVLARKLGPINRERLDLLDAYEAEAGAKPVALEKLVHAMIAPLVRPASLPDGAGISFGTVMGRVYLERDAKLQRLVVAELREVIRRLSAALLRALPGLTAGELYWRLFFTMGAVSHTIAAQDMLALISEGACALSDPDSTLKRLTAYIVPALSAPVPTSPRRTPPRKRAVTAPRARLQSTKEGGPTARR